MYRHVKPYVALMTTAALVLGAPVAHAESSDKLTSSTASADKGTPSDGEGTSDNSDKPSTDGGPSSSKKIMGSSKEPSDSDKSSGSSLSSNGLSSIESLSTLVSFAMAMTKFPEMVHSVQRMAMRLNLPVPIVPGIPTAEPPAKKS